MQNQVYECGRCFGKGKITLFKRIEGGKCFTCNGSGKVTRKPRVKSSEVVYLLHFDTNYFHARHYLGSTNDINRRLNEHTSGSGAKLIKAILEHGISFTVARLWEGNSNLERKLKSQKASPRFCPFCNPRLQQKAS